MGEDSLRLGSGGGFGAWYEKLQQEEKKDRGGDLELGLGLGVSIHVHRILDVCII